MLEEAWEASLRRPPVVRPLTLLQMAEPEAPLDQLARLGIGERDRRLLDLREKLAGPRFDSVATCPGCGERSEFSFDSRDFRRGESAVQKTVRVALD